MQIKDIMTEDAAYGEVPGSAAEALDLILKRNISGLPIVKRGTRNLVGIVTRNDFSRHPEESQLALLMTRNVTTIAPSADVKEAVKIFLEQKFRRMPVVKNGDLVGIVTVKDIVWRAVARMEIKDSVEKYVRENITALWEGMPLKVAYEIMKLSGEMTLPVLNSEAKLVGILSDKDLLKAAHLAESTQKSELSSGTEGDKWGWDSKNVVYITTKKLVLPPKTVKDIMVQNVVSVTKKTSVSECAKKMEKAGVEQVPVIDAEGNMIGMVRDVDLLRAL